MNALTNSLRMKNAVKLDAVIPKDKQPLVDNGDILMSDGVELPLSKSDTSRRVYSKFESPNPNISDTQHEDTWVEEVTAHPKVMKLDATGGGSSISEDDGIILTFTGEPAEEVSIDTSTNRVLDVETAELEEEATGATYPRYVRWDFYLTKAVLTNGPQERAEQHELAEKKRAKAEAATNDKLGAILDTLIERLAPEGNAENVSVEDAVASLDMDQLQAIIDAKKAETGETSEEVSEDTPKRKARKAS